MAKKKIKKKNEGEEREDFFESLEEEQAQEQEDKEEKTDLEKLKDQPEWIDQEKEEGQLAVDVYEEGDNIIVKSTIAGVEPEDINITLVNDMLTIRGERKKERERRSCEYFFQECYWGAFSRSIILPVKADEDRIDATIKNGVLSVTLPKLKEKDDGKKNISIKDENE